MKNVPHKIKMACWSLAIIGMACAPLAAMAQEQAAPAAPTVQAQDAGTAPETPAQPAPAAPAAQTPAMAGPAIRNVDVNVTITGGEPRPRPGFIQFLDRFFSRISGKTSEPDPSITRIAPFASGDIKPIQESPEEILNPVIVKPEALGQPHRSTADLASWLDQAIPETLSFNAENYSSHLAVLGRGFSADALREYNAWVTSTGILSVLQESGMQLNAVVTDTPFLLNEGVLQGRYRWLYEIPVMVSFIPRGATTYRGQQNIETRQLMITLQLGRVAQSSLLDNVMIETWTVQNNQRRN